MELDRSRVGGNLLILFAYAYIVLYPDRTAWLVFGAKGSYRSTRRTSNVHHRRKQTSRFNDVFRPTARF